MRYRYKFQMLTILLTILFGALSITAISPLVGINQLQESRTTVDLPDDIDGKQIHVFYVIPSDGTDRSLDIDGTLERSISAFSKWLFDKTEYQLIFDMADGEIDITFFQLDVTDAEMQANDAWVVIELENSLKGADLLDDDKINLIYYDGTSNYACGGASWPPSVPGSSAAMYLQAQPNRAGYSANCAANNFTSSVEIMLYWEFAMLHDLFHVLGAVATCAPNHAYSGHVGDDNSDLMYTGSQPWNPENVDVNNDDYFGHDNSQCVDVQDSEYMQNGEDISQSTSQTTTPTSSSKSSSQENPLGNDQLRQTFSLIISFLIVLRLRRRKDY